MGFGTLFFGYFLLLNNVAFCGFSDPFAALVLLMGLYKLSGVNRYFRYSAALSIGFAAFSLGELVFSAVELFMPTAAMLAAVPYIFMARSAIIAVLTVTMLRGIWDVAEEVDLGSLAKRSRVMIPVTWMAYALAILMDTAALVSALPEGLVSVLYILVVIGIPVVVIINLTVIHGAYMMICMPEEKSGGKKDEPSRFSFINEMRKRREERDKEYIEYRREKSKSRKDARKK